jgi:hypothetical protein
MPIVRLMTRRNVSEHCWGLKIHGDGRWFDPNPIPGIIWVQMPYFHSPVCPGKGANASDKLKKKSRVKRCETGCGERGECFFGLVCVGLPANLWQWIRVCFFVLV